MCIHSFVPVALLTDSHLLIDRVQKLKDARSEAEKEIEDYKALKEKEFKAFEQSVCIYELLSGPMLSAFATASRDDPDITVGYRQRDRSQPR